jgi:hypothetical protein
MNRDISTIPTFAQVRSTLNVVSLLLLALLIRLIWIPIALHVDSRFAGDIIELNRNAYLISSGYTPSLWYPPLFYLSLGLIQRIILPGELLFNQVLTQGIEAQFMLLSSPSIFRTLVLLKAWYFLFDLASAFVLWKLPSREATGKTLSLFWLFNPLIIYNAYFHGQYDVVPLFFVILGLYFSRRGHLSWAAFWMGIGACYKTFPFLFLLPLVIVLAQTWRERFRLLLWGILPYLILMIPFLQQSVGINQYSNWFFKVGYDLGFGSQVYFFFAFYAALLWYLHRRKAYSFEDLWRACFAILLVYYQFSYFDLHYWAWIVPFAAIYWVERPREAKPFYLVIGLCLLVLLAPTPLARFLAPISPRFFLRLPSLMEALNPYLPMMFIVNVVRSLLAGTCFYLAWKLIREMPASRGEALETAGDLTAAA